MKAVVVSYIAAAVVFLGLDAVWLRVMGGALYRPMLGGLLRDGFSLPPAAAFYFIYIGGVVFFAVMPALAAGRWTTALVNGAALGLVAYATYDLTNQATLRDWPLVVTLADIAWGALLTAATATAAFLIASAMTRTA